MRRRSRPSTGVIEAIKHLRAAQQGPVAVLSAINERLPGVGDFSLSVVEQKADTLTIEGSAADEAAVTRFARALEFSDNLFSNVSIETERKLVEPSDTDWKPEDGQVDTDAPKPEVVKFKITCKYNQPGVPAESHRIGAPAAAVPNKVARDHRATPLTEERCDEPTLSGTRKPWYLQSRLRRRRPAPLRRLLVLCHAARARDGQIHERASCVPRTRGADPQQRLNDPRQYERVQAEYDDLRPFCRSSANCRLSCRTSRRRTRRMSVRQFARRRRAAGLLSSKLVEACVGNYSPAPSSRDARTRLLSITTLISAASTSRIRRTGQMLASPVQLRVQAKAYYALPSACRMRSRQRTALSRPSGSRADRP